MNSMLKKIHEFIIFLEEVCKYTMIVFNIIAQWCKFKIVWKRTSEGEEIVLTIFEHKRMIKYVKIA